MENALITLTVKAWMFRKLNEDAKIKAHATLDRKEIGDAYEMHGELVKETEKAMLVSLDAESYSGNLCNVNLWIPKSQIISKEVVE